MLWTALALAAAAQAARPQPTPQRLQAYATVRIIQSANVRLGELMLETTSDKLIALLTFLRDDPRCLFKQLVDVCGVDWPEREKRFDVV